MKLSEKGKSRIHEMIDYAFEAHPDDAKGVQVLAKKYLTECDDFELEPDDFQDAVVLTIEEAKVIKICDNYNKALNKVAEEFQKQEEIINLKCEINQLKAEQELDNWLKDQFLENVEKEKKEKERYELLR